MRPISYPEDHEKHHTDDPGAAPEFANKADAVDWFDAQDDVYDYVRRSNEWTHIAGIGFSIWSRGGEYLVCTSTALRDDNYMIVGAEALSFIPVAKTKEEMELGTHRDQITPEEVHGD